MTDFTPIEAFLERARLLTSTRSRELRLSVEEATNLAINIGELLNQLSKKQLSTPEVVEVVMNGGDFTST